MILTLLCPILLLDAWTNALPQEQYKISHLYPQPGRTVTLNGGSNEPQQPPGTIDVVSRQTRQSPRDWLYPTFNPPSSYNPNRRASSSSVGLAYRSIIPETSNHYTNYYRNRNLYTGLPSKRRQQDSEQSSRGNTNDNNLNLRSTTNIHINTSPNRDSSSTPPTPGLQRNYNGIVNSNYNNPDLIISSSPTTSSTKTTTTLKVPSSLDISATSRESIVTTPESRSAPATDALSTGRSSSTLQMQIGDDDKPEFDGGVSARDAIGFGDSGSTGSANRNTNTHTREPKAPKDPALLTDEQDSMIIFPGNISRSSQHHLKRDNGRPGKSSMSDDDAYVPPPLKTLDRAALQSLRMLIEARKRVVTIDTRYSTGTSKNNNNRVKQSTLITESLDIKRAPSCAIESGYCEEIDTYPKDFLNQVLKKSVSPDVFQEVFGDSIENNTVATDVVGRNDLQDTPLCNSIEHTIYPKAAKNRDGKFMYVVNHDEYIQGVRVEKCVGENNQCMFQEGNPTGYQSTCRQKFIYKKLLAFTPEGKAMTDTFRLPSCCVCYLRSAFVGDRINPAILNSNSNSNSNNNEPLSSNGNIEETGILPKNSASDLPLNDDKNGSNTTTVNPSATSFSVTSTSADMITFPTTLSTSGDAGSLSEIAHDEHSTEKDDLSTHGMNDTMADIITSGPFFRSF